MFHLGKKVFGVQDGRMGGCLKKKSCIALEDTIENGVDVGGEAKIN